MPVLYDRCQHLFQLFQKPAGSFGRMVFSFFGLLWYLQKALWTLWSINARFITVSKTVLPKQSRFCWQVCSLVHSNSIFWISHLVITMIALQHRYFESLPQYTCSVVSGQQGRIILFSVLSGMFLYSLFSSGIISYVASVTNSLPDITNDNIEWNLRWPFLKEGSAVLYSDFSRLTYILIIHQYQYYVASTEPLGAMFLITHKSAPPFCDFPPSSHLGIENGEPPHIRGCH